MGDLCSGVKAHLPCPSPILSVSPCSICVPLLRSEPTLGVPWDFCLGLGEDGVMTQCRALDPWPNAEPPTRTHHTTSPTVAAPAGGTGWQSSCSLCLPPPRPPPQGHLGLQVGDSHIPLSPALKPTPHPHELWSHLGARSGLAPQCLRVAASPPSRCHPWLRGESTAHLGTPT